MTKSDKEVLANLIKVLNGTKESAPIRYKKEIDIDYTPQPDVKMVVNNTKKGLLQ
jgi:CxxC motif-containing protein